MVIINNPLIPFNGLCVTCHDWSGCTHCIDGFTVTWDNNCGTNVCEASEGCMESIEVRSLSTDYYWQKYDSTCDCYKERS